MVYLVSLCIFLDDYHFRRNDRPSPSLDRTVCEVTYSPFDVSETALRSAL